MNLKPKKFFSFYRIFQSFILLFILLYSKFAIIPKIFLNIDTKEYQNYVFAYDFLVFLGIILTVVANIFFFRLDKIDFEEKTKSKYLLFAEIVWNIFLAVVIIYSGYIYMLPSIILF